EQCLIQGNQEALFNALTNIVENAIQAIKQKPLISLRLSKAGEMFLIEIEDNGPGIDDSIKELIFNPFFSTRAMGTGLGLAVVASAVTEHKGNIQVIPAAQGGTIFRLFIPSAPSCINNTLADDFFIKQEPLRI
ncbi:ATP-binding protein, partial [Gammaproteobacteria bacterium AH-315-E17]|nr:ATP-binding protein [Gammaproteobacteria bacterium AH-315-E17]